MTDSLPSNNKNSDKNTWNKKSSQIESQLNPVLYVFLYIEQLKKKHEKQIEIEL